MNLTLKINGEDKKFVSGFVPAILYRKVLEMNKRMNFNDLSPEEMDEIVELTRNMFNNEFTVDEFYNGLPVEELLPTMKNTFLTINGKTSGEDSGKK
jgi:hypothetical protein